jgi:hypothetical protein
MGMNLFNDFRGQAALVDSLFFIAIVSAVCTALFYFAINYGSSTESSLNSFYSSDFAMDSLKVITYVNVMRDGSAVKLNDELDFSEFDYLLALIKEDYTQSRVIGMDSRKMIANTLYSVLKPFDDSIDYFFYIVKEGATIHESRYIALIIAVHVPSDSGEENQYFCDYSGKCYYINRVFYSCDPSQKYLFEQKILSNVGKVDSAIGKITLNDLSSDSGFSPYTIGLHTWVSKKIQAISNLESEEYNCVKIEGVPSYE